MDSTDVLQRIRAEVAPFSVKASLLVSRKSASFLTSKNNKSYGDDAINKKKKNCRATGSSQEWKLLELLKTFDRSCTDVQL